jgi:hypothetical protein
MTKNWGLSLICSVVTEKFSQARQSLFELPAMRFALCAALQGRANFFMDDTVL